MKTGRQLSITRKHTATEAGRALLGMVRTFSADGRLTEEEALDLHRWLESTVTGDLPAAEFLREVVGRALADGRITDQERQEIHEAVIRVLPPDERRDAKNAKGQIEGEAWLAQREKEKQEWKAQRRQEVQEAGLWEFVAAGVDYEGRAAVVASSMDEGTPVQLVREPMNKWDRNAISVQLWDGRSVGFVPKEVAADLAQYLDGGAMGVARCTRLLFLGDIQRPLIQVALVYLDGTTGVPGSPVHDWVTSFRSKVPSDRLPAAVAEMKEKVAAQVGPAPVAALDIPADLLDGRSAAKSKAVKGVAAGPRREDVSVEVPNPMLKPLLALLGIVVAIVLVLAFAR